MWLIIDCCGYLDEFCWDYNGRSLMEGRLKGKVIVVVGGGGIGGGFVYCYVVEGVVVVFGDID